MLAQQITPTSHAAEGQSSNKAAATPQFWSVNPPEPEAESLTQLAQEHEWLRVGDVVYVTTIRRYTLTDADLNVAARAVIGGAA